MSWNFEENIDELRVWLNEHKILNSSSIHDIPLFKKWIENLNIVYLNVGRKVSLVAIFIVTYGLVKDDKDSKNLIYNIDIDDQSFSEILSTKLFPIYEIADIISFIEACLYLNIPVFAEGRRLIVFPEKKGLNATINKVDLADLTNQGVFIKKLEHKNINADNSISIQMNLTETNFVLTSYKSIIKSIRFESLIPKLVELVKDKIPKIEIYKLLQLRSYQYDQLIKLAIDRGKLDPSLGEKKESKPILKEESKLQNNGVILSDTNFGYVKQLAEMKYSGNMYQAVNSVITAMRNLQEKTILNDKLEPNI